MGARDQGARASRPPGWQELSVRVTPPSALRTTGGTGILPVIHSLPPQVIAAARAAAALAADKPLRAGEPEEHPEEDGEPDCSVEERVDHKPGPDRTKRNRNP